MKYISRCQTPIGELTIVEENSKITNIIFENSGKNFDKKNCIQKETPLLQKTCSQLAEYFAKKEPASLSRLHQTARNFCKKSGERSKQSHMVKQKATKKLQNK